MHHSGGAAGAVKMDRGQSEQAVRRIMQCLDARTQVDLAKKMGFRQASISYAIRQGIIPDSWFLRLALIYRLNPLWVAHGTGAKFLVPQDTPPESPDYETAVKNAPVPILLRALAHRLGRTDIHIVAPNDEDSTSG